MTTVVRWIVVAVLVGHGLIHFLGVAKGFGWAEVPALKQPIGARGGVLWLLAATLVLASAVFIAVGAPTWWWVVAVCAAAVSQVAIATSWSDAKAGTVVNVLLVLAAGVRVRFGRADQLSRPVAGPGSPGTRRRRPRTCRS